MNNMSFPVTMSNDFKVEVATTNNRGSTPEEVAQRCVNKIVGISENAHPVIRDQAREYRGAMEKTIALYMRQAIQSDRTTLLSLLTQQGHKDMADILRKI